MTRPLIAAMVTVALFAAACGGGGEPTVSPSGVGTVGRGGATGTVTESSIEVAVTPSKSEVAWRTAADGSSGCVGSVRGRLILGYGHRGPAVGEWIQIEGMPGDPAGSQRLVRTSDDGGFRVDGVPIGCHRGHARHATFDFAIERCGQVLDLGFVEYPLVHPSLQGVDGK